MGVTIALILPSVFYIKVYTKTSCDRLLAQGLLLLGVFIMVTGTYLHLNGIQNSDNSVSLSPPVLSDVAKQLKGLPIPVEAMKVAAPEIPINPVVNNDAANNNIRKEPVVPEPPNVEALNMPNKVIESIPAVAEKKPELIIDKKTDDSQIKKQPEKEEKLEDSKPLKRDRKEGDTFSKMENKKEDTLHPDAIQKEEKEKVEENVGKDNIEQKQEEILKKMESQQKEQKLIIEEQKKILKELIDQKEKIEEVVGNPQLAKEPQITKEEVKVDKKKIVDVREKPHEEDKKVGRSLDNVPLQEPDVKEKVDLQNQVVENLKIQPSQIIVESNKQKIAHNNVPSINNVQPHSLNGIKDKIEPNVKKDLNIKLKDSNNIGPEVKLSSIGEKPKSNTKIKNPIEKVIKASNIVKKAIKVSDDDPSLKHDEERKKRDVSYLEGVNQKEKNSDGRNIIKINEEKNIVNDLERNDDQNIILPQSNNGNDNQKFVAQKIDVDVNKKHSLDDTNNRIKETNRLSYEENIKLGDDNQQAVIQESKPNFDPLFESRHLLWLSRRTRRRKRRHEQFPEYWDEI
ncbi:hypothetical protein Anas_11478 [Armadillidium nasatum]|uniref:Sodium-coupled neutral amino acid transporter 10 n=1 Tax=Armadillidium nasatum TaxID=96803 RepID=A0A5N5TC96_9CRUS|nr:hypothetical protein Anas_11478 [Armadillidium nasatum]